MGWQEVIYINPTPEELERRGEEIESMRMKMSDLRNQVLNFKLILVDEGHGKDDGITADLRDVEAFMTAGISRLYKYTKDFPSWAKNKRETMATAKEHPERYIIEENPRKR